MTKKRLIIWIPIAALLVNGLIYFIVSNARSPEKTAATGMAPSRPPSAAMTQEQREAQREAPERQGDRQADRTGDRQAEQKEREDEKTAIARRAIGLAALEAGDYEKALINFTEARSLLGDKAQVNDLLRVTEELRGRPGSAIAHRAKPPTAPAPVAPPPARPANRTTAVRHVATKETVASAPEPSPAPEPAPPAGLLIVTTTPRGLLVQVDETPVDLTPMRSKVSPGSHRIVLLDGDRKVYESTFFVKDGATATVLKDLSSEVAAVNAKPVTAPAPSNAPTLPALAKEEAPRPALVQASAVESTPPSRLVARNPFSSSLGTGALAISSPGLYGVVWVNGRPRGYPPVEIRDMPLGPTRVEVRVNGVEKRSSTVVVKPGVTTPVNLRSVEASP